MAQSELERVKAICRQVCEAKRKIGEPCALDWEENRWKLHGSFREDRLANRAYDHWCEWQERFADAIKRDKEIEKEEKKLQAEEVAKQREIDQELERLHDELVQRDREWKARLAQEEKEQEKAQREEERRRREAERAARDAERASDRAERIAEREAREAQRLAAEQDAAEAERLANMVHSPNFQEQHWYSHSLLLARTRFGKTNVIRWWLQQLLPQIAAGRASVVLMEPKGVLTDEVLRLADVWSMRDRVVILDPTDTRISVNVFSKGDPSDLATQETIGRVMRVLNTVTTTLTPFQQDALTFCLRAMFCVDAPGSMRLLTTILRRGLAGLPIRELPRTLEEYFANDFKPGDTQAQQIITRLNGLLANPIFEALFDAEHSTFDMFKETQAGKLIVINASAADHLYARFWIEQVNACITPRYKLLSSGTAPTPTTFVLDEAQTWIAEDLHFAEILDKAAEAKIGMLIAAHHMRQITNLHVRGSIYTNATLKFAARTSEDIYALCRSMGRTEQDFIQTLPQYEFAYFGPDMDTAIKVKFPLVEFDKMPRMSEQQYQELRAANRERYSYVRSAQNRPVPTTQTILPRQEITPVPQQTLSPEPSPPTGPITHAKDSW